MQATTAPIPDIGLEDEFVESVRYAQLDLKKAASNMTNDEARFLVNRYYDVQNDRKAYKSQSDSLGKAGEPTILVNWMAQQMASTENHIKKYLDAWSDESIVGKWAKSNFGIGPVISAGLLAHIDISKAPHVSHIYSYAGLNPAQLWLGKERAELVVSEVVGKNRIVTDDDLIAIANLTGRNFQRLKELAADEEGIIKRAALRAVLAKRPWNSDLKTLCYKIGDCIVKFCNSPKSFYGPIYRARKDREIEANINGMFREQAEYILATKNFSKDTEAKKAYEAGMLPPAHIHQRAARFATKVFLAHWHQVAFESTFHTPASLPYVNAVLGHSDYTLPPNYEPLARVAPRPTFDRPNSWR